MPTTTHPILKGVSNFPSQIRGRVSNPTPSVDKPSSGMKMLYVLSPPRTPPPSPWTSMRDSSPSSCPSSNSNSSSSINSSCSYASSQSERRCGDGGSNQRDVSSTYPLRGGVSTNGRRGSTDISSNLLRKKDISTNLLREDNISTNLLRGEDTSTRRRSAGVSTNDYFQRSPISTFPGDAMSRKGFTSSLSAGRLPLLDGREKICPSAKIMPGIRVSQSEKSFGRSLEPGYSLRCSQSERRCDGRDSTLSVPRPGRGNTVPEIVAGGKQSKATRNWLKAIEKANARGAVASPAGNYGPAREAIDARGARLPGGNFPSTELPVSHGAEESVPAGGWECARKGSEGEREAPPRRFTKTVKCRLKRKVSVDLDLSLRSWINDLCGFAFVMKVLFKDIIYRNLYFIYLWKHFISYTHFHNQSK